MSSSSLKEAQKEEQKSQMEEGGEEEQHKKEMEEEEHSKMEVQELAEALPPPGAEAGEEHPEATEEPPRREPTKEDMVRYGNYVGQKWTGTCKWFNVTKGFGFIVPAYEEAKQYGDDVFVHQSSLQMPGFRSLDEGESVEFTIRLGKRGLEAENVTGVGGAPIRGHRIHPLGKRKEKEIRCYKCGQFGHHKAAKCKRMPENVKVCYICFSRDHLIADCPNRVLQQHNFPGLVLPISNSNNSNAPNKFERLHILRWLVHRRKKPREGAAGVREEADQPPDLLLRRQKEVVVVALGGRNRRE